jgi:hypothetical protein
MASITEIASSVKILSGGAEDENATGASVAPTGS